MIKILLVAALLLPLPLQVLAQYDIATLDLDGDLDTWYTETLGLENQDLFEGTVYLLPRLSPYTHYFYESERWVNGEMAFDGRLYRDIEMIYDLVDDVLVIRNPNFYVADFNGLRVKQSLVSQFKIGDTKFVRLEDDAPAGAGFYHLLYESDVINVYIKHKKVQEHAVRYVTFTEVDDYYFEYQGNYFTYIGASSLYKGFPEQEKELKQFIRRRNYEPLPGNDLHVRIVVHQLRKMIMGQ